jgi:hypothetical protein
VTTATPPFPEAALRATLAAAVAAWARHSPAAGDLASAEDEPRRVYVDAFAGAELQFGTGVLRDAWEPTRAEAAVRALDAACAGPAPPPVALFVEEDPAHLQRIYTELEEVAGGERLRATADFASLAPGEVSLVEAPFASIAAQVARFVAGSCAFYWLAPGTARALPWEAVERILAEPRASLLIRFPHADFEKQSRHAGPLADLPGFARRIVEGCSSLLADPKHAWLPAWRADVRDGTDTALAGVLGRFRALLERAAGARTVRSIPLDADGAHAWCFLVTADKQIAPQVADAATSTEIAEIAPTPERIVHPEREPEPTPEPTRKPKGRSKPEPKPKPELKPESKLSPAPAPVAERAARVAEALDLFPDDVVPGESEPDRPDPAVLGREIESRFRSRTATWGEVQRAFEASDATSAALKAALKHLRRGGRALYETLRRDEDEIVFPAEPVPPTPAKRHTKTVADDGLFGDSE